MTSCGMTSSFRGTSPGAMRKFKRTLSEYAENRTRTLFERWEGSSHRVVSTHTSMRVHLFHLRADSSHISVWFERLACMSLKMNWFQSSHLFVCIKALISSKFWARFCIECIWKVHRYLVGCHLSSGYMDKMKYFEFQSDSDVNDCGHQRSSSAACASSALSHSLGLQLFAFCEFRLALHGWALGV